MMIRLHHAISLDGFSADTAGRPALMNMPTFDPGVSYDHPTFFAQCDAVVVGRGTFEPALGAAKWPWPGQRVYVLTSGPITAPTGTDVELCQRGPAEVVDRLRTSGLTGDVHLLGGPGTVRAFYRLGLIDRLEILVLPLLLGAGKPLFPLGGNEDRLVLLEHVAYPDGTVKLCYDTARP
jgi:dihydrofolate reductase